MKTKITLFLIFAMLLLAGPLVSASKNFNITDGSSSLFFVNGSSGNIGIGTSSPEADLEINTTDLGGVGDAYGIMFNIDGTKGQIFPRGAGRISIAPNISAPAHFVDMMILDGDFVYEFQSSGNAIFQGYQTPVIFRTRSSTDPISFEINSVEKMRISSAGNVGIGTISPGVKLDVNGTTRVINSSGVGIIGSDWASGIPSTNHIGVLGHNYFNDGYGIYGSSANAGTAGYFTANTGIAGYFTSTSGYGLIVNSGNVGIATTTPQNTLNVVGDANVTGLIYGNGSQLTDISGTQINNDLNWLNATDANDTYVPYVGADQNVDLGSNDLTTTGTVTATGMEADSFNIPTTASYDVGVIKQNGNPIFHTYGAVSNLFLGGAGNFDMTGYGNIGIGTLSLRQVTDGNYNIGLGSHAARNIENGSNNIFIGGEAGAAPVSVNDNIGIGYYSLWQDAGDRNVAIGTETGWNLWTADGSDNVLIGYQSGYGGYSGDSKSKNVGLGTQTLYGITSGDENVALGYYAGKAIGGGIGNVFLGNKAGETSYGNYNIIIGHDLDTSVGSASNELNIGGTIYGNLSSNRIGINTSTPQNTLNVVGTLNITNATGTLGLYQDVNGSVGIGREPYEIYNLDVAGYIRATERIEAKGNGSVGTMQMVQGNAAYTGYIGWRLPAEDGVAGTRLGYMGWSDTDIVLTLQNSADFVVNGGNVGIGDSTPDYLLDVAGTFGVDSVATFASNVTIAGTFDPNGAITLPTTGISGAGSGSGLDADLLDGYDSSIFYNASNPYAYYNSTNPSPVADVWINSSGEATGALTTDLNIDANTLVVSYNDNYVGIGTNNPLAKLHVNQTGVADTPLTLVKVFNNIPYSSGNGLGAARIEIGHGMSHGYIEGAAESETNSAQGYMAFGTRRPTNNVTEAMRISSSGNVGIGTTSPDAKLEVIGNAIIGAEGTGLVISSDGYLSDEDDDIHFSDALDMDNHAIKDIDWSTSDDGSGSGLDADLLDNIDSTRIVYGTNQYATSNGRVNLSTISKSGFYFAGSGHSEGPASNGAFMHLGYDSSDAYGGQIFVEHNANEMWFRNKDSGVFGPWNKLWQSNNDGTGSGLDADLLDGLEATHFYNLSNPYNYYNSTNPSPVSDVWVNITGDTMTGNLNMNGQGIWYAANGSLGLGTLSPEGKLAVRQGMSNYSTSFTSPHIKLMSTNTVDTTGFVGVTYAGSTSDNYGWSSGALRSTSGQSDFIWKHHSASEAGTEYMRIKSTGEVGIGDSTPDYLLDVAGTFGVDSVATFASNVTIAGTFDPNGAITLPTTGISGAGSGSGLDADLLDTYTSDVFLRRTSDGYSGDVDSIITDGWVRITGGATNLPLTANNGQAVLTQRYLDANYGFQLFTDDDAWMYIRARKAGSYNSWYKVWAENNDGSGSTLDADLLDGYDSSIFYNASNPYAYYNSTNPSPVADVWINSSGEATGALTTDLNIDANTLVVSYNDNYVGIGTSSPNVSLEVLTGSSVSTSGQTALRLDGAISWATVGSGPKLSFYSQTTSNELATIRAYAYTSQKMGLSFDTGYGSPSSKMFINNEGLVGIGTTSPSDLLSLYDADNTAFDASVNQSGIGTGMNINNAGGGTNGFSQLLFTHSADVGFSRIASINRGTGDTDLAFVTSTGAGTGSEQMRITQTGNVGIGTTSPTDPLTIQADGANTPTFSLKDTEGDVSFEIRASNDTKMNVVIGVDAGTALSGTAYLGQEHVFVGYNAGKEVTTAEANTIIGARAGDAITTGSFNSILGRDALTTLNTGLYNTGMGARAGQSLVTGSDNVFLGMDTGRFLGGASSSNTMIGRGAGYGSSGNSFYSNTLALGYYAGGALTTGNNNILLGWQAGNSLTTGGDNIIIGYDEDTPTATTSSHLNIGGVIYGNLSSGNVGIGTTTPQNTLNVVGDINATTGVTIPNDQTYKLGGDDFIKYWATNESAAVGKGAGSDTFRSYAFGNGAGQYNSGTYLTATGYHAGRSNDGNSVTATGYYAGKYNTGGEVTALGRQAGYQNTGSGLTATGYYAGQENKGDYLTATGATAGYKNIGNKSTFAGTQAGQENTGNYATLTGYRAGYQNTGISASGFGYQAMISNSGGYVTAMGYQAGQGNTGDYLISMGALAGYENDGDYLTAMGYQAGRENLGNQSSGFGYESIRNNTADNVVAIGYQAGKDNTIADQFIVQQANVNAVPLIQGNFSSGNVGIGTASPVGKFHVQAPSGTSQVTAESGSNQNEYISFFTNPSYGPAITWESAAHNDLRFGTTTAILGTGFSEKMRITSTGRVGIETTTPQNTLNVVGDINATGLIYGNGSQLTGIDTSVSDVWVNTTGDNMTGNLEMSGQGIWYAANGGMGIGTTDTVDLLTVATDSSPRIGIYDTDAGGSASMDAGIVIGRRPSSPVQYAELKFDTNDLYLSHQVSTGNLFLQTNSSTKMTISNDGDVGIGTTSPDAVLHLAKGNTPKLRISYDEAAYPSNYYAEIYSGGSAGVFIDAANVDQGMFFRTSTVADGSDLSTKMAIKGGNVGIGTIVPVNKLDVEGAAVIGATYSGTNTAPTNGLLVEGNVGIGTTSPTAQLHTNFIKTTNVDHTSMKIFSDMQMPGANLVTETFGLDVDIDMTDGRDIESDIKGINVDVNTSGSDVNSHTNPIYGIDVNVLSNPSSDNTAYGIKIDMGSSIGNNYPAIFEGGNVGIGTATPQNTLNVIGDFNVSGATPSDASDQVVYMENTGGATGNYITLRAEGYSVLGGLRINGVDTTNTIYGTAAGNIGITTYNTASDITFNGGSANELMRIEGTGNVGIGTASPSSKLVINGTTTDVPLLGLVSTTSDAYMQFSRGSGSYQWKIGQFAEASSDFEIRNHGGTPILHLDYTGNVGINTTAPGALLEIAGIDPVLLVHSDNWNKDTSLRVLNDGKAAIQSTSLGFAIMNSATSGYNLFVKDDGSGVGIGTTTPQNELNVVGDANITGDLFVGGANITGDYVKKSGDTMAGTLNMNNNLITNIGAAGTDFTAGGGLNIATDITVTDDLFVNDFARVDALRVGTTSTDPGDGQLHVEGDVIFEDEIKPDGLTCSNGQILAKTGADNWDCVYPGQWTYVETITPSSSASVVIDNIDSSWRQVKIVLSDFIPATNSVDVRFQFSTTNAASWIAAGYVFANLGLASNSYTVVTSYDYSQTSGAITSRNVGSDAGEGYNAEIIIWNPGSTTTPCKLQFQAAYEDYDGHLNTWSGTSGFKADYSDVDAVKFYFASGNIESGKVHVYRSTWN